jgi:hypothetical protein
MTVGGEQVDLLSRGREARRALVERLIADIGPRPASVGGAEEACVMEGLKRPWSAHLIRRGMGCHLASRMLAD